MIKRAFFGGFKSNLFFWIFFIISILFILFNLASFLLTILLDVLSWISLDVLLTKIFFEDQILLIPKLAIQGSLNVVILLIQIIIFGKSISYTIFMFSMKSENDKIGNENKDEIGNMEEGFEFKGKDMRDYYFQPINNTTLPKNLFYNKTENRRRQIFIPENSNLIIQPRQPINNNNFNNFNNQINNNINQINYINNSNLNNNSIASETLRLKNNNSNFNNININRNRENIIRENNNSEIPIDANNNESEIIRYINENNIWRNENEKLRQKIQIAKNELGKILGLHN